MGDSIGKGKIWEGGNGKKGKGEAKKIKGKLKGQK